MKSKVAKEIFLPPKNGKELSKQTPYKRVMLSIAIIASSIFSLFLIIYGIIGLISLIRPIINTTILIFGIIYLYWIISLIKRKEWKTFWYPGP